MKTKQTKRIDFKPSVVNEKWIEKECKRLSCSKNELINRVVAIFKSGGTNEMLG